jgi:hypothetical protein
MSNHAYLSSLLQGQALTDAELLALRTLRDTIEKQLATFEGQPRFYYGGSYGKDTIIKASYDLDIVMYWPHDRTYTLDGIFTAVGTELRKHWKIVQPKNVAWSLPFEGGFHVDVVPGRALDATFRYANLWRSETAQPLQTSIKVHIDHVRKSGRRELIRLLKLWKVRRQVPVKSFVLEIMAVNGATGTSLYDLEPQLNAALAHIRDNILTGRIVDPANTNNDLAATMSAAEKLATYQAAVAAIQARTWGEVFG